MYNPHALVLTLKDMSKVSYRNLDDVIADQKELAIIPLTWRKSEKEAVGASAGSVALQLEKPARLEMVDTPTEQSGPTHRSP